MIDGKGKAGDSDDDWVDFSTGKANRTQSP